LSKLNVFLELSFLLKSLKLFIWLSNLKSSLIFTENSISILLVSFLEINVLGVLKSSTWDSFNFDPINWINI